ncbi:exopolysaccharide Pel transporter PelG [Phosphitispora sp. TUW77]|uniref:exopolysaccharide Pel transporter PelG n=1 Tax=Phosphitispora sp. TUW77 TaxID=3152361 RepID=UPI003AB38C35
MAGIGFTLKKLFREESYSSRTKAYLYSALVAAGPWIASVITINTIIFITEIFVPIPREKQLLMGTMVYSFVFSQIFTAPWQILITRYISDKLYSQEYDFIRPSFIGLNKILASSAFIMGIIFYFNKDIPFIYKTMSVYLFIIITMIWILMVYMSAVKNYQLIAWAYILGGVLSIALTLYFSGNPIPFSSLQYASNLLFAYLAGLSVTFLVLAYNFLSTFYFGNRLEFDFLRYFSKVPSLFLVGLFYTLGLWIDDIIMWFSIAGVRVYDTYLYAPIYDNAVFLAYLTVIPSMVMFLVSVETSFYDEYKTYYGMVNKSGTFEEIEFARKEMGRSLYRELLRTFQVQALISVTLVMLSGPIFDFFNISIIIRDIFKVCTMGALFNIFILLIVLVLLYFEVRIKAILITFLFFASNLLLTVYYAGKGLKFYGYGFTISSLITVMIAMVISARLFKKLNFATFALQPVFEEREKGLFVLIADYLNRYQGKPADEKSRLPLQQNTGHGIDI